MKLNRLHLQNFCRLPHQTVDFHNQMTVVVGPNGSGKTTILEAVYLALTGDYSRLAGVKLDNICQLAPAEEPSNITLEFEHNGVACRVTRHLRPEAKTRLLVGTTEILGDTNATTAILDLLGVNKQMLSQYVFVGQGRLFTPLSVNSSTRAVAFQRLFGIEQIEKIWQAIGGWIGDRFHSALTDTKHLETTLREQQTRLVTIQGQLQDLAQIYDFTQPVEADPAFAVVQTQTKREELLQELFELRQQRETPQRSLNTLKAEVAESQLFITNLEQELVGATEIYTNAKARLQEAENQAKLLQQMQVLRQRCEDLEAWVSNNPAPEFAGLKYITAENRAAHQGALEYCRDQFRRTKQLLQLAESGQETCPTCGSSLEVVGEDLPAYLARLQAEHSQQQEEVDRLAAELSHSVAFDNARATWKLQYQANRDAYTTVTADYQALQECSGPLVTEEQKQHYQQQVAAYDELANTLLAAKAEAEEATKELTILTNQLSLHDGQIHKLAAALGQTAAISPEELEQSRARIKQLQEGYARYLETRGAEQAQQLTIESLVKTLDRAREQRKQQELEQAFIDNLQRARSVLHKDNLPRVISQYYLLLLTEELNTVLRAFDADFTVRPEEGLSFTAHFYDGRVQSMARLSGGQQVILAWAFMTAVNSMFAGDLGVLALDEPTVFLDEHNLERVHYALGRLKVLSDSRGLQVIMVTHEQSLSHAFDQVIRL